jgi:hypothetical protein
MRMASKEDNKRKYAADGTEEEAEEVPLKKQKMIGGEYNCDDHGNGSNDHDDDGDDGDDDDESSSSSSSSSSSTDDDYKLEPEEEGLFRG